MTWDDFVKKQENYMPIENLELTNIECPKCGNYICRRSDIVLTSNPPKSQYVCLKCGWIGSA